MLDEIAIDQVFADSGKPLKLSTKLFVARRLANGICVGVSESDVRKLLGQPQSDQIVTEKFRMEGLVYDQYTFLLDKDAKVSAIRVGRQAE